MFQLDICDICDLDNVDQLLGFGQEFGVSFDLDASGDTLVCPVDRRPSAVHLMELSNCWMSQKGQVRVAVRKDVDAVRIHMSEMKVGGKTMTRPFYFIQR